MNSCLNWVLLIGVIFLSVTLIGIQLDQRLRAVPPVEQTQAAVRDQATRQGEALAETVREQNVKATTEAIQTKTTAVENYNALLQAQEGEKQATPLATPGS